MPNLILFDPPEVRVNLLPFTFTRPISAIRIGILTIAEKWEKLLHASASFFTQEPLNEKFPLHIENDNLIINARYLPTRQLLEAILNLKNDEALVAGAELLAARCGKEKALNYFSHLLNGIFKNISYKGAASAITNIWDIFLLNDKAIAADFELITSGRTSQKLNATNTLIGSHDKLFIEEDATVNASVLNTATGYIYIGRGAEIMEGCAIRGPLALCEHAVLKMSSKLYGATTIGPYSKAGGEINNSVIFGYSNKAHDGFLGNSVIGEWCNLGADTNNSNLKNNYAHVKLWSYAAEAFVDTGLQFCGLFMGDHSKCGINTMFNTGTVVGVSANIFGSGFPRNFIPSFSWGGAQGFTTFKLNEALHTARLMMQRRDMQLTTADEKIMEYVFYHDEKYRVQ